MGSYGIGPSRVMGLIAEHFADERGLVWPEMVAPFKVYLVRIGGEAAVAEADKLYAELVDKGVEVLYDDRDERPGKKFADAELMGIPHRVTVSDRLLAADEFEYMARSDEAAVILTRAALLDKLI